MNHDQHHNCSAYVAIVGGEADFTLSTFKYVATAGSLHYVWVFGLDIAVVSQLPSCSLCRRCENNSTAIT